MSSVQRELAERLALVRERIEVAASRGGRRTEQIVLVAVSKTHSPRRICELHEAGVRHFGENRVQERESKLARVAGLDATWHMIGHLQKNKAARATGLFDSIDSLDSVALAQKLDRARSEVMMEESGKRALATAGGRLRVLVEVKLDPEPAKSGAESKDVPRLVEAIMHLPHLELRGLMGVPPYFDDPEETRPYFRALRELRDAVQKQMREEMLPVLSMGMSHDFEIAIEEGATEIRVGTALFGERETA